MADVRCPMCGKPNPEEAEICEFCQARLKPLVLSPTPSEGEPDLPDWLSSLRSLEAPEADQISGEAESDSSSDWFASSEERNMDEPPAPSADTSGQEEPVDWLESLEQGEETTPEGALAPTPPAPEAEHETDEAWGSLSDWLSNLKPEEPPAVQETAAQETTETGEEEPQLPETTIVSQPSGTTNQEQEESFTEWLSKPSMPEPPPAEPLEEIDNEEPPAGTEETAQPAAPAEAGELPDWLTALTSDIPEDISKPIPAGEEAENIPEESPEPGDIQPVESEIATPEITAQPVAEAEELPEWLSQIDRNQPVKGESVPAFTMDEELATLEPEELAALEEATAEALSLPDWVAELNTETQAETPAMEPILEEEADLAQARLPDWLEAMRPVEAVAPEPASLDQSDNRMESAGPLAGLRGVLPGDMRMPEPHKLPAYTLKIPLTDEQGARLQALQDLVEAEGQAQPLPTQKQPTSQWVLRLIVFALLVLVSITALWLGRQTPLPAAEQIAPEVLAVEQLVNALLPNQPVLFVIDYEPGFADEMNTVVMPVLDHLAARNLHLAFVATSPTGPILAVNLVAWLNRQPAYTNAGFDNYTNLGFLPGGANGIRAFAQAPAQTVPGKLDGSPAWAGPLATAQQRLDQFGMVVVASDDPEGARQWIEQAGPLLLQKTPLILLTSAQAGPVILPYYAPQTGLVAGLVSGMVGGAAYYSATSRASVVPFYWDAFSLALNGVVVFIVLGGFVSLVSSAITQRKAQKGEENT